MTDLSEIAGRLTRPMSRVLQGAPDDWFHAGVLTDRLIASAGSLLTVLSRRGLFERRSDPTTWGRSQYRLTLLGLAVRHHLEKES